MLFVGCGAGLCIIPVFARQSYIKGSIYQRKSRKTFLFMVILSVAKREKFSKIIFKSLNFSEDLGYVEQKVSQKEIVYH